jgi:hypothetical protein
MNRILPVLLAAWILVTQRDGSTVKVIGPFELKKQCRAAREALMDRAKRSRDELAIDQVLKSRCVRPDQAQPSDRPEAGKE